MILLKLERLKNPMAFINMHYGGLLKSFSFRKQDIFFQNLARLFSMYFTMFGHYERKHSFNRNSEKLSCIIQSNLIHISRLELFTHLF